MNRLPRLSLKMARLSRLPPSLSSCSPSLSSCSPSLSSCSPSLSSCSPSLPSSSRLTFSPQQLRFLSTTRIYFATTEELGLAPPLPPTAAPPPPVIEELNFTLPERPVPLEDLVALGEPAFDTMGLATWWPSGRVQLLMEWLHVDVGMDWWPTIMACTLLMRLVVFPVVVISQRNLASMTNNGPRMARINEKMNDARRRGDQLEAAQLGHELQAFQKEKGINPVKNMAPMMFQMPVFLSMFFGLRGMAYCPVDSMSTGGLAWFSNLTVHDPYLVLPIVTAVTLYVQLKVGAEGAKLDTFGPKMQVAMAFMPLLVLFMTYKFPAAVCLYWATNNFLSLAQAQIIKQPKLKALLKIPAIIQQPVPQAKAGKSKKNFIASIRESIDNADFMSQIKGRQQFGREYDEKQFRAAATKTVKTFKYDPTKPVQIKFKDGKRMA